MFHTLNGSTLQTVEQEQKPIWVSLPTSKRNRFHGSTARSSTGCLCCRKRKKKCDEVYPTCTSCKLRGEECVWPDKMLRRQETLKKTRRPSSEKSRPVISSETPETSWLDSPSGDLVGTPDKMKLHYIADSASDLGLQFVVHGIEGFKDDLTNFQMELEEGKTGALDLDEYTGPVNDEIYIPTEFLGDFGFPHISKLDKQGVMYLECYREKYCKFISIGTESSNYLRDTFMSLASTSESITYALTAWGGFYIELQKKKSDFSVPWSYMQKSAKLICQEVGSDMVPKTKDDLYHLLAFYLTFIGMEVCTGDIRNWRGFLNQCAHMIKSFGGIKEVVKLFNNSNGIRWLISDFQFHDILSSETFRSGPLFPVSEYRAVLVADFTYGVDPLSGIAGEFYNIMGEIGAEHHTLSKEWSHISRSLAAQIPGADEMRKEHLDKVDTIIKDFLQRIDECEPSPIHLQILANDKADREVHIALFELLALVCKLQLASSIMKLPPNTPYQQRNLTMALQYLDQLQPTRVKVALSLALLVCGVASCTSYDRDGMTKRFRVHANQYEIGNLQRIEETVQESWRRNPTGDLCIDWADIVHDKNWQLYVG